MTLLVCWGAFGLLALAACAGWGLLVERATGRPLPGALIAPLGLAATIVVSQLLTIGGATAELASPAVALGAIGGLVAGRRRLRRPRIDVWLLAAAVVVFTVCAAPVVSHGQATFAGYGVLGDTAVHFVLVDWLMHEGATAPAAVHSAYDATLVAYLNAGYPTGAHTALGSMRAWVGQDVAWVYAPFLALLAALAAVGLTPLVATVLADQRLRALAVACAGVPALAFAYVQQGAIKEIATICMLALLGGLVPWFASAAPGARRVVPVAVAAAASLCVISLAVAPWLVPLGAVLAAVALRPHAGRARGAAIEAGAFAGLALLLALPALTQVVQFTDVVRAAVTSQVEFGNLLTPLSTWQVLPAWPIGDFRLEPQTRLARLLVGVPAVAIAVGLVAIVRCRSRSWPLIAWLVVSVIGWRVVTASGSPWADAKALAIVSPAFALTAAIGAAWLWERHARVAALALGGLLAAGIAWTLVLAGQAAPAAPRERLADLQALGPGLAGRGPVLYPQFEEYAKHFLRQGDPDSPAESYGAREVEPVFAPGVRPRPLGASYDLDDLAMAYVAHFRTIVMRRGPASAPPAIFRRVRSRGAYEQWQRPPAGAARWLGHLGAGGPGSAGARPDCAALRSLARAARAADPTARLVAAVRPQQLTFDPGAVRPLPVGWAMRPQGSGVRAPVAGSVAGTITVPAAGSYDLWLGGVPDVRAVASIDGRRFEVAGQPQAPDQWLGLGRVRLSAGRHAIALERRSGTSQAEASLGPVALTAAATSARPLVDVAPGRYRSLCERSVDWVDALIGSRRRGAPRG